MAPLDRRAHTHSHTHTHAHTPMQLPSVTPSSPNKHPTSAPISDLQGPAAHPNELPSATRFFTGTPVFRTQQRIRTSGPAPPQACQHLLAWCTSSCLNHCHSHLNLQGQPHIIISIGYLLASLAPPDCQQHLAWCPSSDQHIVSHASAPRNCSDPERAATRRQTKASLLAPQ